MKLLGCSEGCLFSFNCVFKAFAGPQSKLFALIRILRLKMAQDTSPFSATSSRSIPEKNAKA